MLEGRAPSRPCFSPKHGRDGARPSSYCSPAMVKHPREMADLRRLTLVDAAKDNLVIIRALSVILAANQLA